MVLPALSAATRGYLDVHLGAMGERHRVIRRALRLAVLLVIPVCLVGLSSPALAGPNAPPPPKQSCSQQVTASRTQVVCTYMSGSSTPPGSGYPQPSPTSCPPASWSGQTEFATTPYQLPPGQGAFLSGLALNTTNPATGGSYYIPAESQVIPVSSAYYLLTFWNMTETPGGTAKNPTCHLSASYAGAGYEAVPVPCATAGDCATPPTSQFNQLMNEIATSWSPSTPTSSPLANFITVWVPTVFTAPVLVGGKALPIAGEIINTAPEQKSVGLPGGQRQLNIEIQLTVQPVAEEWQYTAQGAQSGNTAFTCYLYSPYPELTTADKSQQCNPIHDPNAGEFNPSGNGYIFTHDATKLTVQARVLMQVSATAYFNTTQPYVEHLKTQRVWTLWSGYEHSIIQQVEGVTVP